ncbi:S1 family peptidase [Massilia rubra]|uniref:Trypsin-like serine protease n=1 Tax=Massilia rubra TaxID=2607910 RepID=A0ABX0LPJ8_9BURK|nr:trypsin-like serine protease [Massilia rubra]NHZ33379.1 trypsin-like serine protease [Massilia rubra]
MISAHRFQAVHTCAIHGCIGLLFLFSLVHPAAAAEPYSLSLSQRNELTLTAFGAKPEISHGSAKLAALLLGKEKSQCEVYGRRSTASGAADVVLLGQREDGMSIQMAASATAIGGHYRTCGMCASDKCVVVFGHDTRANSVAQSTADIAITFPADAADAFYIVDVGVAAHGSAPAVKMTDQAGKALAPTAADASSFKIQARPGAIFYLSAALTSNAGNTGACCSDQSGNSARLDVNLRKAPLLASQRELEPYIGGGKQTTSYKSVGALLLKGELHCTGTLIGKSTVLTAAHCLHGYEKQLAAMTFLIGANLQQPTFGPVAVSELAFPKDSASGFQYNAKTLEDDIGLVYLAQPANIAALPLHDGNPNWKDLVDKQTSLTFVGYGYDVVDSQPVGSGIKREGSWYVNHVENRRVSFGVPGKNTCKGDSGGPAFLIENGKIIQVAITSSGSSDCTTGVETRVDAYKTWLASRIR